MSQIRGTRRFTTLATIAVVGACVMAAPVHAETRVANWTLQSGNSGPNSRNGMAVTYDAASATTILFGGASSTNKFNDTWSWDGTAWAPLSPPTRPPARADAAAAYDEAHGQIVLFGGAGQDTTLDDTWLWDGTTWTQAHPATSPSARYGSAMAYDTAIGKVVLVGGDCNNTCSGFGDDTWVWDGADWARLDLGNQPGHRISPALSYDAERHNLVLFGGATVNPTYRALSDTWVFDGTAWTQRMPTHAPAPITLPSTAYDDATGTVVLYEESTVARAPETWTWDGTDWTQQHPASTPADGNASTTRVATLTYDTRRGQAVFVGQGVFNVDVWTYAEVGHPVSSANSTAQASPSTVPADGTTTSSVIVSLRDPLGQPVPDKRVRLAKSAGPGSPEIGPASGPSDATGQVRFNVTSTTAGVDTFTATDVTDTVAVAQSATVAFTAPAVTLHRLTDFDGNGASDASVFRPADGAWFADSGLATGWGAAGDVAVPGDYDGDGKTDVAIFRPSTGLWAVHNSSGGDSFTTYGGLAGDVPVPGDYDGDGRADIAVFRPSTGAWFVHRSSDGTDAATTFGGIDGDVAVPGDYDGDGRADIAIFRSGTWFVHGSAGTDTAQGWGGAGDVPVPGDYDGDAKADIAIFRPSTGLWAVHGSASVDTYLTYGGISGDIPVPADYDGDTKADIAVFRPSVGGWYVHRSSDNADTAVTFGLSSDVPLPLPYSILRSIA